MSRQDARLICCALTSLLSGLANAKTVDVSVDKADTVRVGYGSVKNANKPKKVTAGKYVVKSNARRALKAIGKQVASFRPDLKVGAQGSVVGHSLSTSCFAAAQ